MQVAERTGLEPATPGVTGRYSNRLNYRSGVHRKILAERTGLEPATPGVTGRYSNRLNYRSAPSTKRFHLGIVWCGGNDTD